MIVADVLLFMNFHLWKIRKNKDGDPLESYLQGVIAWTMLLFAATEVLSAGKMVCFAGLLVFWIAADMVLLFLLLLQSSRLKRSCSAFSLRHQGKRLKPYWFLGIIALGVTILALVTVPYNWDSMTYHLPRIMHWTQNRSVAHYATNSIRQIASPVLAEFVNLHVYILSGFQDQLFNLLQCFSYITGAVIVCGITRKLQGSTFFCLLAGLLYMSMPIAFAEALTTQVDNYATLWLLIFVYFLLDFTGERKLSREPDIVVKVCSLGLCVSFGYLTKPSVCIGMAVMVIWLLAVCIRRKDEWHVIIYLLLCVLPCIILPLIPELIRNTGTFHALADPSAGQRQLVGTANPLYLFINFLKNAVFNLPNVYIYDLRTMLAFFVKKAAALLCVPLNDPSIAEDGRTFALHGAPNFDHDTALNPLIMWLFIICMIWYIVYGIRQKKRIYHTSYSIAVSVSFLLFCMVLRWEPYVTRYMISYLAILCPMIACTLEHCWLTEKGKLGRSYVVGIICFVCITDLISMGIYHRNICVRRSASERPLGYFVNRTDEYEPYLAICREIADDGFTQIGLYMGEDHYEYPLWRMLPESVSRLEHVLVSNESAVYADDSFLPECIIWLGAVTDKVEYNGTAYELILQVDEQHGLLAAQK